MLTSTKAEASPATRRRTPPWGDNPRLEAAAISVVAFVVLLATAPSGLWLDESISARWAALPFPSLARFIVEGEANMALFHVLLWPIAQSHPSDLVLRVLPVAFGALALGTTYLLGVRLFDRRTGALATGILAVHGLTSRYATEVRGYSLLVLLTVCASLLLVDAVRRNTTRSWVLYTVVAALALTTHFFAALTILAQLGSLLTIRHQVDRARVLRVGIALGLVAFGLAAIIMVGDQSDRYTWVPSLSWQQIETVAQSLSGGTRLAMLVVGGFALFGSVLAMKSLRNGSIDTWPDALLLLTTWIPLIGGAVVSLVHSTFLPRYLLAVLPALALLVSRAVLSLPRRPTVPIAAAAVVLAVVLVGHPDLDHNTREGTDVATEYVTARLRPGDAVFLPYNEELPSFQWYGHSSIPPDVVDAHPGVPDDALATDWWWEDPARFGTGLAEVARTPPDVWRADLADRDRVWVVSGFLAANPRFHDNGSDVVPEGRVECDRQWFNGVDVVLWARTCD